MRWFFVLLLLFPLQAHAASWSTSSEYSLKYEATKIRDNGATGSKFNIFVVANGYDVCTTCVSDEGTDYTDADNEAADVEDNIFGTTDGIDW